MASSASASEIIEVRDELDMLRNFSRTNLLRIKLRETEDKSHGDLKASPRVSKDTSKKSVSGISESPNLKQALRKLCISQASEMAVIKRAYKRLESSSISDAGAIERQYALVSVETCKSNLMEVSTMPKKLNQVCKACITKSSCKCSASHIGNVKVAKTPNMKEAESGNKSPTNSKASLSSLGNGSGPSTPGLNPRPINACSRKKGKNEVDIATCKTKSTCSKPISPSSSKKSPDGAFSVKNKNRGASKVDFKVNGNSRSTEVGESFQSSKSSLGDYSSSTSISKESNYCGYSNNYNRPHMSKDVKWAAIHHVAKEEGSLGLKNFKLLQRLGCGDIGTVYLAELLSTGCLFALKVMDIEFLVRRKKMLRAQTERDILQKLDHPFLPTLYAHFTTDNLSFLVMEYCPGGDLHVLRQMQPSRSFHETIARFYVAEVLLALEYLHLLGVIYRDLKPENILVRDDGHIMLSDFNLSMRGKVNPTLLTSSSQFTKDPPKNVSPSPCIESNCIEPFCLEPSCFTPHLPKIKSDISLVNPRPQLVVEPTDARSNSFVGTHEYLAPEIIRGDGHGSSVDWWTLGIFLFELLFGRTPFKGSGNEDTVSNVVSKSLRFPESVDVGFHTKDLISRLLIKEPDGRLGSVRGAAEIKQHPFFEGLNWALIRCASPPEVPGNYGAAISQLGKKEGGKYPELV